jgi:hypothetical protein
LEQEQVVNWEKYGVPDFLMGVHVPKDMADSEQPLVQRLFLEVKSVTADKENFLLPLQTYNRLQRFCQLYKPIPLYFAIRARTIGLAQWFLLSLKSVERLGKVTTEKIGGRREVCIRIPIIQMPLEDLSGLWLSNYYVLVPKGLCITSKFRNSTNSPIADEKYGKLAGMNATLNEKTIEIKFNKTVKLEDILFDLVLKRLQLGKATCVKHSDGCDLNYETDVNYWIPFYWLVLDCYLDIRKKLEPQLVSSPNLNPDITYFLRTFSQADWNIATGIRKMIWELHEKGIVLPMKMLPERLFDKVH